MSFKTLKLILLIATNLLKISHFGITSAQECKAPEILSNISITNLNHTINFNLHNRQNLSNYEITVTYTWNVKSPEGSRFDGFVYCFNDVEERTLQSEIDSVVPPDVADFDNYGGLADPEIDHEQEPYQYCQSHFGHNLYHHHENGTYTACEFPCRERVPDCSEKKHSICNVLDRGCRIIQKNHRNYTFFIKFGRVYSFKIFPYLEHFINPNLTTDEKNHIEEASIFCGHHFIENEGLPKTQVYEFCQSEQNISVTQTASGPPSNLTLVKEIPNYLEDTVTITVRWKAPYDIREGGSIYRYFVAFEKGVSDDTIVQARSPENELENPYYTSVIRSIPFEKSVKVLVTPSFRKQSVQPCPGHKCPKIGKAAELEVFILRIDTCADGTNFCHPLAVCDISSVLLNRTKFANCSCPPGYAGDGYNPAVVDTGKGCQNYNACLTVKDVHGVCAPEAFCIDAEPPSMGIAECRCRTGYTGDGQVSGTGCRSNTFIIGISIGLPLLLMLGSIALFVVWKYKLYKRKVLDARTSSYVAQQSNTYTSPLVLSNNSFNPKSPIIEPVFGWKLELNRTAIDRKEIIGRGNFGVVHKASIIVDGAEKNVAVKSLTGAYSTHFVEDFLAEISLLSSLRSHENIVHLIGVCTVYSPNNVDDSQSPLMVTEYMEYGDLLHFLWDSREETKKEEDPIYNFTEISLHKVGCQVAHGLHFLSQSRIIHGDVAARNMLVGTDLTIKISDFGLANDVYRYGVIKCATERRVPFKWISPERMLGGSTPITWRSDVWSFGILLYEMVTLGAAPYAGMEPVSIFQKLQSGYRIPQPSSCSDHLYKIMKDCWQWNASKRPTFNELEERLNTLPQLIDLEDSSLICTAIETLETIDPGLYERDIGRRDSPTFELNEREMHLENIENGIRDLSNTNNTNFVPSNNATQSHLWSGDIIVDINSNEESCNSLTASELVVETDV